MSDLEHIKACLDAISDPAGKGGLLTSGRASAPRLADGHAGLILDVTGLSLDVRDALNAEVEAKLKALPGVTEVWVHRDELDTPYARRQRGIVDDAPLVVMDGAEGQVRPGLSWFHTPGHAPGHVAVVAECDDARVIVAGDTLGPDPGWFRDMAAPDGLENRDQHLAAWRMVRDRAPAVVVPGHYAPFSIP